MHSTLLHNVPMRITNERSAGTTHLDRAILASIPVLWSPKLHFLIICSQGVVDKIESMRRVVFHLLGQPLQAVQDYSMDCEP